MISSRGASSNVAEASLSAAKGALAPRQHVDGTQGSSNPNVLPIVPWRPHVQRLRRWTDFFSFWPFFE